METLRERLRSAAFGAGWRLVCRLPEQVARALFMAGADIAWRRQGEGVRVLEGNLIRVLRTDPAGSRTAIISQGDGRPAWGADSPPGGLIPRLGGSRPPAPPVLPGAPRPPRSPGPQGACPWEGGDTGQADVDGKELRTLSRAVLRSYARHYLEMFRLQVIPAERIAAGMHINLANADLTLEHLKNGRGVIYALPHMGDFEQAGRWIIDYGVGSFTTVAERLEPESVFQRFLAFRQGLGMEVLPTAGGPHPFGVMAQRLRAGKLVCLVADRDLSGTGIEVDFLGEKALFPAGPAVLAVQTGAALMPVSCWFAGDTEWGAHIYDEIPVPSGGSRRERVAAVTQALASVFERAILDHPEDWHMLQRIFVSDLDPERLALARGGNGRGGNGGSGSGGDRERDSQ